MTTGTDKTTGGTDKATSKLGPDKPPVEKKLVESVRPGPASLIGVVLSDRYKIERLLGEGGMGAVYQAEHMLMRKRLAVKVLHPEMSRMREVVARFEREAMAAAHINHPNVAAATDFGKLEDGSFFLVLEYIEGKSLRASVAEGRLELGRALNITRQIVSALVRAHSLGIVHRDLKPENVMLVERDGEMDFVKVLDFGIAKVPIGGVVDEARDPDRPAEPAQPVLTQAGMVYGTPEYMAPEQALGNPVDARADLYAVGIMAYEMIVGVRPFDAESKVKILGMHVVAPVPTMREMAPDLDAPAEVEAMVRKLLAKEADDRFQDAKELLDTLSTVVSGLVAQGKLDASLAGSPPSSLGTSAPLSVAQQAQSPQPPHSARAVHPPNGAFAVGPTDAVIALPSGTTRVPRFVHRLVERGKREPKFLAMVGGGALLLLLVLVGSAYGFKSAESSSGSNGGEGLVTSGSVPSGSGSGSVAAPTPALDEQVREGVALVEKKDYASGLEKLNALPPEGIRRAEARRALATAYAATDKYEDCMSIVSPWLKDDPTIASDQKVRIMIRDSAISTDAVGADLAFGLLEADMGTIGPDDLYDIAYGASGQYNPKARDKARHILKKADTRARMTPALAVTLDVVAAGQSCKVKDLFERAQTDGDLRTVAALKPLVARVPTGWFGKKDALQCIHDGTLTKTIAAIDARMK